MGLEAVQLFQEVPQSMVDSWTYVSVLNACSHSGLVDQAEDIFSQIPEQEKSEKIVTSMVQHFLFSSRTIETMQI